MSEAVVTLREVLSQLSEQLPERFRRFESEVVFADIDGMSVWPGHPMYLLVIEHNLRQEIDNRNWQWVTQQFMKRFHPERAYKALVYRPGLPADSWGKVLGFVEAEAPTPTQALAVALLAALNAELPGTECQE